MSDEYIDVCVLKRCGDLTGPAECCKQIKESGLKQLVLDALWDTVNCNKCSLYRWDTCVFHGFIKDPVTPKSYCYPVQVVGKRINVLIVKRFARLCARRAAMHVRSTRYASYAMYAARYAARYARDAAMDTRDAARYARDAAMYARDAAMDTRDAARYTRDAAMYAEFEWQRQCLHDLIVKHGDEGHDDE